MERRALWVKPLRVLYDGWALAHDPGGPAALHLLALLTALPPEVEAFVALPGPAAAVLPACAMALIRRTKNTSWRRLAWEQRILPGLVRQSRAAVLHVFAGGPLAAGGLPVGDTVSMVCSPAEPVERTAGMGLAERLRAAFAAGAFARLAALLWPADLPPPKGRRIKILPPLAHPVFTLATARPDDLPEPYILLPDSKDWGLLAQALKGWSWCAGFVGEITPLVMADRTLTLLDPRSELEPYTRSRVAGTPEEWAGLYQNARAVLCLGRVMPWSGPLLNTLAAGRAIISVEDKPTAARVGSAAYLVPKWDNRALGAALTTLAVEDDLAAQLASAARERARAWGSQGFGALLAAVYHEVTSP